MTIQEQLLEKSKEAFLMAIEVYNKPTIRYRLEGFSFFICNAWELMLKAHLINKEGENTIYYSDKPNRTISLDVCVQRVFTNINSPINKNLSKIIELRNTSTHFITEEYEMVYVPLLQACVFNYVDKMKEFHNIDMTKIIPENFINLSIRFEALNEEVIRAKYTQQVAEKLINVNRIVSEMISENNSNFAIRVEHHYYQTKDRNDATEFYHIEKEASEGVRTIKELKNPNNTHKYNAKKCITEINKQLDRKRIVPLFKGEPKQMNSYFFQLFLIYFGLKQNEKYCFVYQVQSTPIYSYSQQTVDFIVNEIEKDPEYIFDRIKEQIKQKC